MKALEQDWYFWRSKDSFFLGWLGLPSNGSDRERKKELYNWSRGWTAIGTPETLHL